MKDIKAILFITFLSAFLTTLACARLAKAESFHRVHTYILEQKPWKHSVETFEERDERTLTIARAIVKAAAGDNEVLAFLLVYGEKESNWARHVHKGECRRKGEPWPDGTPATRTECDGGYAAGPWQAWRISSMTEKEWWSLIGTDLESTTDAAQYSAKLFRMKRNYCGSTLGGLIAYGTGHCESKKSGKAKKRLKLMKTTLRKLRGQ